MPGPGGWGGCCRRCASSPQVQSPCVDSPFSLARLMLIWAISAVPLSGHLLHPRLTMMSGRCSQSAPTPGPTSLTRKDGLRSCCTAQPPYHHHHMGGGWVSHLIQAPCDEPVSARGRRRWLRPGCPFWLDPAIARAGKLCSCSLSVFSPSSRPWRSLCLPVCDGGPAGGLSAAVPVPVHSPSHDSLILFRLSC